MTPAERKRAQWRKRQRKKRLRENGGIGSVTIKDNLGALGDFLREAEFIPSTAEDDPAILSTGLLNMVRMLRDMRDNVRERNMLLSQQGLACPFCERDF